MCLVLCPPGQDNQQHWHYLSKALMGTGGVLSGYWQIVTGRSGDGITWLLLASHPSHSAPIQRLSFALMSLFLLSHCFSCVHRNSWMIYQKYTYPPGFSHALKVPRSSKVTNQLARTRWKTRYQVSTRSQEKPTNCLRWELSEKSLVCDDMSVFLLST